MCLIWGLLVVSTSCGQQGGVGNIGRPPSHADLVKEAEGSHNFVDPRGQIDDQTANISDDQAVPRITITTRKMKKKFLHFPKHEWVAVINASDPYPRLGLGPGNNYIFKIPDGGPDKGLVVVPQDQTYPSHYLRYDPSNDLTHGHPDPPRVYRRKYQSAKFTDEFVIGGCIECGAGSSHCSTLDVGALY